MAIALARDIIDGERIISGAHTEISFAAAMLAQKMHAPNIKLQLGGTCFLVNVVDLPVRLPKTSTDYRMLRWAEIAGVEAAPPEKNHDRLFHFLRNFERLKIGSR